MVKVSNPLVGLALAVVVLLGAGFANAVSAQPTDAELKKQLTHAKTVSVTLGKPGTREWSSTYKKWVWNRHFTAKLKTDDPDIFVIVKGYASYDFIGGRTVFWRTFTTSNSYEGIPDPTAADVQALIAKFGLEQFIGNYTINRLIGKVESIGLSDQPKFKWHTVNSVSFNVIAVYTERTNDIGGKERLARTFEIRLYRDNPKQEWKSLISTARERKVL
ncbi:MAG: hypothetical protein ACT4OT_08150 [Acidobacteriota bacterium]